MSEPEDLVYPGIYRRSLEAVRRRNAPSSRYSFEPSGLLLVDVLTALRLDPLDAEDALELDVWPSADASAIADGGCKEWHAALRVVSAWVSNHRFRHMASWGAVSVRALVTSITQWCPRLSIFAIAETALGEELFAFSSSFKRRHVYAIASWLAGAGGDLDGAMSAARLISPTDLGWTDQLIRDTFSNARGMDQSDAEVVLGDLIAVSFVDYASGDTSRISEMMSLAAWISIILMRRRAYPSAEEGRPETDARERIMTVFFREMADSIMRDRRCGP